MKTYFPLLLSLAASATAQFLFAPENITVTIGLADDFAEVKLGDDRVTFLVNERLVQNALTPVTLEIVAPGGGFLELESRLIVGVDSFSATNLNGQATTNCRVTERTVRSGSRRNSGSKRTEIDITTACSQIILQDQTFGRIENVLNEVFVSYDFSGDTLLLRGTGVDGANAAVLEDQVIFLFFERQISALGVVLATFFTICCCCACCIGGCWMLKVHLSSGSEVKGYANDNYDPEKKEEYTAPQATAQPAYGQQPQATYGQQPQPVYGQTVQPVYGQTAQPVYGQQPIYGQPAGAYTPAA